MILKLLLLIAVIGVVYFVFFKKESVVTKPKKGKKTQGVEELVKCSSCGVYCEINEAILSNGKYYCSQECLKGSK